MSRKAIIIGGLVAGLAVGGYGTAEVLAGRAGELTEAQKEARKKNALEGQALLDYRSARREIARLDAAVADASTRLASCMPEWPQYAAIESELSALRRQQAAAERDRQDALSAMDPSVREGERIAPEGTGSQFEAQQAARARMNAALYPEAFSPVSFGPRPEHKLGWLAGAVGAGTAVAGLIALGQRRGPKPEEREKEKETASPEPTAKPDAGTAAPSADADARTRELEAQIARMDAELAAQLEESRRQETLKAENAALALANGNLLAEREAKAADEALLRSALKTREDAIERLGRENAALKAAAEAAPKAAAPAAGPDPDLPEPDAPGADAKEAGVPAASSDAGDVVAPAAEAPSAEAVIPATAVQADAQPAEKIIQFPGAPEADASEMRPDSGADLFSGLGRSGAETETWPEPVPAAAVNEQEIIKNLDRALDAEPGSVATQTAPEPAPVLAETPAQPAPKTAGKPAPAGEGAWATIKGWFSKKKGEPAPDGRPAAATEPAAPAAAAEDEHDSFGALTGPQLTQEIDLGSVMGRTDAEPTISVPAADPEAAKMGLPAGFVLAPKPAAAAAPSPAQAAPDAVGVDSRKRAATALYDAVERIAPGFCLRVPLGVNVLCVWNEPGSAEGERMVALVDNNGEKDGAFRVAEGVPTNATESKRHPLGWQNAATGEIWNEDWAVRLIEKRLRPATGEDLLKRVEAIAGAVPARA